MRVVKTLALTLAGVCAQGVSAGDAARDHLNFMSSFESKCVILQGEMRQLINTHPKRAIEVYLYRYMGKTQQPGRLVETVPAGKKPIDLGCTRQAGGSSQDWQIVKAEFKD
ncbi:MAG: hypothetical protein M3294_08670 [Pseudomonadota bacterium]|nr:hypothetical protein [Pseudomonadota bacterium]